MKTEKSRTKLKFPETKFSFVEEARKNGKLKELEDKPLQIRFVEDDIDKYALTINLLTITIIYFVTHFLLGNIQRFTPPPTILIGIPSVMVAAFMLFFHDRMWVNPDAQTAVKYLDSITRTITLYFQGFHFVPWYSTPQDDTTNFQKHTEISARQSDKTAITFQTSDGYDVAVNLVCFFNRREAHGALNKSMKYNMAGLNTRTRAIIASKLAAFGGLNAYNTLLENKDTVAAWISDIFGGEGFISQYEEETGLRIFNPIMESFDLADESKKIYAAKAKAEAFTSSYRELAGTTARLSASEASDAVQVATGVATRNIVSNKNDNTYKVDGLPSSVTVFAPGSNGIAIGSKGGK